MRPIIMTVNRLKIIIASLALLLGVAHIIFGVIVFGSLTLEAFWFMSFGLTMILAALGNFKRDKIWVLRFQNMIVLLSLFLLLSLVQGLQIWFGALLFLVLLVLSCLPTSTMSKVR